MEEKADESVSTQMHNHAYSYLNVQIQAHR